MDTKVKITAMACGMFLAVALLLTPAQAGKKTSTNTPTKASLSSLNAFTRYKGECVGSGVCMEDSSRIWYGKWHEY